MTTSTASPDTPLSVLINRARAAEGLSEAVGTAYGQPFTVIVVTRPAPPEKPMR